MVCVGMTARILERHFNQQIARTPKSVYHRLLQTLIHNAFQRSDAHQVSNYIADVVSRIKQAGYCSTIFLLTLQKSI